MATYVYRDQAIPRPYFAHVCTLGGIQVTRSQPPVEGKELTDHPSFHPGIWLTFGDLGDGDFWRNEDKVVHEAVVEPPLGGTDKGAFAVRNRYEKRDGEVVCRYTFLVRPDGNLLLRDFPGIAAVLPRRPARRPRRGTSFSK